MRNWYRWRLNGCRWRGHHWHSPEDAPKRKGKDWKCSNETRTEYLWTCCWCGAQKWASEQPIGRGDYGANYCY